jgi:hypothetical protein
MENLAEFSNEGYGSESAVFPMMIMMMMMITNQVISNKK